MFGISAALLWFEAKWSPQAEWDLSGFACQPTEPAKDSLWQGWSSESFIIHSSFFRLFLDNHLSFSYSTRSRWWAGWQGKYVMYDAQGRRLVWPDGEWRGSRDAAVWKKSLFASQVGSHNNVDQHQCWCWCWCWCQCWMELFPQSPLTVKVIS